MALARGHIAIVLGAALPLLFFFLATEAGEAGVNYGRVADNLPDPALVSNLLKDNGITTVRIYDTNSNVLKSLANTGTKVTVMMPNQNIAAAAADPANALQWVKDNVVPHLPDTKISGIAVGNEVFKSNPELNSALLPAMNNVYNALVQLGLADALKVTTPVSFEALQTSFPPSSGRFKDDLAPLIKSIMDFLRRTGSCHTMNIYPFFAYASDPSINLDYALGNSNSGVYDGPANLMYYSLLDAQIDAMYHAIEALETTSTSSLLGESKASSNPDCLHVSECGWPTRGKVKQGRKSPPRRRLLDTNADPASVANAQAFNNNLINRILSGNTGTPYRPDADISVYIFALFNEDGKGSSDDVESNFGLFDHNMNRMYDFSFKGKGTSPAPPPMSWCVAKADVGDERLQAALDYACGHGADCSAIQPGGSCFDPNTKLAHASYAVNSYYQNNHRAPVACDFNGAASIVNEKPADTCGTKAVMPMSWCVANAAVGDARLKTALDYACANGADCSAIQPGGSCFQPDTMVAHASYAFNSYYQNKGRASGTCDFSGAGSVVNQEPANTCGKTATTWCVANSAVGDARLKTALDYACSNGADCSAIQAGGACFDPNTMVAHASYAFNSYYQHNGRAAGTCDFSGAGSIVNQAPKFGNCILPSNG